MSQKCQQKLTRLLSIVRLREGWRDTFQALKRMHRWIVETERILAAEWGEPKEVLTTAQVAQRFDRWASDLEHLAQSGTLNADEQRLGRIPREHWRQARAEARQKQSVQLKMFRFKHHRDQYLKHLEARWVQALADT